MRTLAFNDVLIIETRDGKKYGITPEDEDNFPKSLSQKRAEHTETSSESASKG
ncbi:PH domain-containing protein [Coprothermobacter platensis]|uniref:PH domain-containing protein n=1 Tax=Coprothermobacter platensis TaxID=108819 RepID=UPI0012EAF771